MLDEVRWREDSVTGESTSSACVTQVEESCVYLKSGIILGSEAKARTGREAFLVALKASSVSGNHQSGVVFDPT